MFKQYIPVLTLTKYSLLVFALAGSLLAADSTSSSPSIAQWSSTLGRTIRKPNSGVDRINTALSYRLADEIELGIIRLYPYLTLGWYQDDWRGHFEYGSYRIDYDLGYLMLEGYAPTIEAEGTVMGLHLGGGLGISTITQHGNTEKAGPGYLLSTGLNLRRKGFICEIDVVFHNEVKTPAYSINLGYQTNSLGKAALMPTAYFTCMLITLILDSMIDLGPIQWG